MKCFKERRFKGKNFNNMKNKKFNTKQCLKFNGGFGGPCNTKKQQEPNEL
jgi:hypothetical protein